MKLEALEKAVVTTREQARVLETKVRQLTRAARTAKDKARQAKLKLKLARQESKRTRREAKDAKRTLAEALAVSEAAAREVGRLEVKIKKARQKAQPSLPKTTKSRRPKPVVQAKPGAAKSELRSPKPRVAKSASKPGGRAKPAPAPVLKRAQPVPPQRESAIQVPRDFETRPSLAPASVPKAEPPTVSGSATSS